MLDLMETTRNSSTFKTLTKAIMDADLASTLKGAGPYTVFAPSDAAFAKIPKAQLDALLKDKTKLKALLLNHVVSGNFHARDIQKMQARSMLKTAAGKQVPLSHDAKGVTFGDKGRVITQDIDATNGVIHVIDSVLMPS
jgi:uncharacterized surface protein with fasciclin (FAS1) repeats